MDIESCIRKIPDYPKKGILFYDITPLLGNGEAFQQVIDAMYEQTKDLRPTKIVSAEARGFIFGAPLALRFGIGFVPIRKPGKLPSKTVSASYDLEYGSNTLCMHEDALTADDRALIVDDVLATGGTAQAMAKLVEQQGAAVAGFALLLELDALKGREKLGGVPVHSLLHV
ncbi:MAG: adenine phosphoribosyltransferase [Desulfovibrio sp.]|nr:adenine phosphoribosyltransferase [Desulfovibrio sp.]MBQ1845411.1 adenine phosphoribosyltransferase [Desulfovibrio sp.]MBQ2516372.1 adenine phosphoribosyltransferase [Desulfovibrio sp.]MCR5170448.1 adenine phosphoribosyltransferase [Desulfovibrio sp.]